jgi:hypothetical protein
MEKITWTDRVRNKEVLQRVKEERKINWIGHILRGNCLLNHVVYRKIEERIEVAGR